MQAVSVIENVWIHFGIVGVGVSFVFPTMGHRQEQQQERDLEQEA